jgi:tetratricopeptide (TPR) repeat protein
MLFVQNRPEEAKAAALRSLGEMWLWADTHLTLAEAEQTLGRPREALVHAETAQRIGKPDTLLIVNPLQYSVHPLAIQAVCLAQMGRLEEAVSKAEEGLAIAPSYPLIAQHLPQWRGQLKRHHTMGAFLACADTLVESGEPLKAAELLGAVPFYVADAPAVIGKRVEIARLIEERKRAPRVAVDEAADKFVERHREMAA